MISANQLKKGVVIEINGEPHIVETVAAHTPSARGGATLYKIRTRSVITDQKVDHSCKGDEEYNEATFEKKPVQFLYRGQDRFCFMDLEDYSQFELPAEFIGKETGFLTEDLEVTALLVEGTVKGIQLPDTVTLEIAECDPSVKSSSATARTKNAVVETGFRLQVPEHLEVGEVIRIDTRDGRYLGKA